MTRPDIIPTARSLAAALSGRFAHPPSGRRTQFYGNAALLEEVGPPRLLIMSLAMIVALMVAIIIWAAVSKIPESVTAEGEVKPVGAVHVVQHLEGGIVEAVLVEDGTQVRAGQTLLRLAPTARAADLDEMKVRHAGLALRSERLRALIGEREPDFSNYRLAFLPLVVDQQSAYRLAREAAEDQKRVLLTRIAQRKSEINVLSEQATAVMSQIDTVAEELKMRGTLLEKKLVSRIIYLETEREHNRLIGQLAENMANRERAELAVTEALENLAEFKSRLRNDTVIELGAVAAELAQVEESITKLTDRVVRLEITAPVDGVVSGLEVKTAGAVIEPGAGLMEIVPEGSDLQVEAKVAARDIGHIEIGQNVDVKISTFDFSRYGSIDGRVRQISANSFVDDEGNAYYRAKISLGRDHVVSRQGEVGKKRRLMSGMTAQADIVTGSRSVLKYLLKPVYLSLASAFDER